MSYRDTVKIQNVVGSTGIDQELALEQLAKDLEGSDYNPDNFPGLIYRLQDPKATTLIFRSGKIVCTGSQSVDLLTEAITIVFGELSELGIPVPEEPDITIQNIVSGADLGKALNLNALAIGLGLESVEYEPEQFPGLVYRLDDPSVVILLFGSGKLVITGAKTYEEAVEGVEVVAERVSELGLL
ncbi:TATA-box-binding protein [Halorubraceae archaeon YAN]|nr:TATA-box-binding protein [Halorubraceae archaeon YAN]